jgi:hypothetical protein
VPEYQVAHLPERGVEQAAFAGPCAQEAMPTWAEVSWSLALPRHRCTRGRSSLPLIEIKETAAPLVC